MTSKRAFYSVTTLTSHDDNGITTTFGTRDEAETYRAWAQEQGLWFVSQVW